MDWEYLGYILGDWAYYVRITLLDWMDMLIAKVSGWLDVALRKIGILVLDKFVYNQFRKHISENHSADFEVCPQCSWFIRKLDQFGQWLVGVE